MKVLFVLNSCLNVAGPSNHLLFDIIQKLDENGHSIHILEKKNSYFHLPEPLKQIKNLTISGYKSGSNKGNSFIKRYLSDIKYSFGISKHYKDHKDADIVFLQSNNTAFFHHVLLKVLLKKPILYNVQDIFPVNVGLIKKLNNKSIVYKILKYLQKKAYDMSSEIITISPDMKETLKEEGVDEEKINVIYNWANMEDKNDITNHYVSFEEEYKLNKDKFKVVYAGNIGEVQNVELVINAARILMNEKQIHFYIIGDGRQKLPLKKIVEEEEITNVTFYPFQPSYKAIEIYKMANINVIPLKSGIIKTALPSKTAACMYSEKPIISCTDEDSQFANLINSVDNCVNVDCEKPNILAESILSIYKNTKINNTRGQIDCYNHYFSKNNVNRYIDLLEKYT